MSKTPIVLMTFAANDLPNVQQEIEKTWNSVQQNKLIQAEKVENATIEQLADAVIDAGKDLFMFHFGGHADENGIVLDGFKDINKTRLSRLLLPKNHQVQLIFLNGCLSHGHVDILTAKGVKAIIATNVKVNDSEATRIATYFYKLFFEKDYTLKEAFETAEATVSGNNSFITIVNRGEACKMQSAWTLFVSSEHKEVMDQTLEDFLKKRKREAANSNNTQIHTGSGDNVDGDKIDRQINIGAGSTYIENPSPPPKPSDTGNNIQNLVANGQLEKALDALSDTFPDQQSDIILLKSRLNSLNRNVRLGIIAPNQANIERNRITAAILDLV